MKRRTLIRSEAQDDIRETVQWYDRKENGLGERFMKELGRTLRLASKLPLRFPVVGDDVRRALLGRFPYSVYFKTEEQRLIIIAVLHQHRRPDIWRVRK